MSLASKLISSFKNAINGIWTIIKSERNVRIHLLATVFVIGAAYYINVSKLEWLALIICCGTVIAAEAFNSAIENLCDVVTLEKNAGIKIVKDIAAGAVLIIVFMSIVIGFIIFLPKILAFISN